jgi:lysozyme
MNDITIPPEATTICKKWEGYHKKLADGRAAPYLCPARVATIGIGTTIYPDGRKVSMKDDPISEAQAEACLSSDLMRKYAPAVHRAIKVQMHPWMWAACYSLAYNIGTGAFAKSTLVLRINAQRWSECPEAFRRYKIGGGRVLTGLLARRTDEAALFMRGVAKLAEVNAPKPVAPTQKAPASVDEGPWWAAVVQGILNGIRGPGGIPVPA